MAHQMHNTGLDGCIRERGIDGVWEAFEAVYNGDQDIFYAPIAQIVHHREPELGPSLTGRAFVKCPRGALLAIHSPSTSRSPSLLTPRAT